MASWPARSDCRSRAGDRGRRPGARGGRAGRGGAGAAAAPAPGRNLGLDFLPGALDFEAGAGGVDPELAGRVLWFDALVGNVDRSWRNPNMLFWHGRLQLIDHGAALTFHHHWAGAPAAVARPYDASTHALLECEPEVPAADADAGRRVTPRLLGRRAGAGARRVAGGRRARPARRTPRTWSSCWPGWPRGTPGCPGVVAAAEAGGGGRRRAPRGGEPAGLARAAAAGSHQR